MPQLKDTREVLTLSIKSIEGSEVILKNGLLAGDVTYVSGDGSIGKVEMVLRALVKMMVEWNLTDDKDQPLPMTLDNIRRLKIEDVEELLGHTSYGKEMIEDLGKKKGDLES